MSDASHRFWRILDVCFHYMWKGSHVWKLEPCLCSFLRRDQSASSVAEDVCEGKGCVTGLVPENLSQPLSSEPAETPAEGHDTRSSLSLHQAFHMSHPSLSSAPGWRKTRKPELCCFSCSFSTAGVRLYRWFCYSFCVVETSWLALIWLIL